MSAKRVLILGATSAIAGAVARIYAKRGAALFLIGRSPDKLAALCEELGAAVVGSNIADFTHSSANAQLVEAAVARLGGLDIALVAHGVLGEQQRAEHELAHAEELLAANFGSAVSLLLPLANLCEAQGRGQLAVLTSVAGDRGRPRNYTYGAAKRGLGIYLEGIRSRLWAQGIGVHEIRLGPVDTPMTVDHPKTAIFASAEQAAAGIVRAVDARRRCAYVPGFWRPIMFVVRIMPEWLFQRFDFLAGR